MPNLAIVGLGKMGLSHLAIANAMEGINVAAICDSSEFVGRLVEKYCRLKYENSFEHLLANPELDAVLIATPSRVHNEMIRRAIDRRLHVFCEKPLTLSAKVSEELAEAAEARGIVAQVGYHNRFVATFREAKRLIEFGTIGRIIHIRAEAYGPVILKSAAAATWRGRSSEGGGCLYDYAAHPINLMNWYLGRPEECVGAVLANPMSADVDDAVYATLRFADNVTGQVSVNWSDGSVRKMTTQLSVWGEKGKIYVDRQELQLFCNSNASPPPDYKLGWNVKYITELTAPVSYYLRGEEYSAQIESFCAAVKARSLVHDNSFRDAADTDFTIELIRSAACGARNARRPGAKITPHLPSTSDGHSNRPGGRRTPRVLAVASGGGHWVQLERLRPAFRGFDVAYVSMFESYRQMVKGHSYYVIPDASRFDITGFIPVFWRAAKIVIRERPAAIVTTGSAPMLAFLMLGRLIGAKTLWIDSIANSERLSSSGRLARKLAHQVVSQWPTVAATEGVECWGSVL